MKLCIRLQQHGKKNHPYWWIVVAPQHKNIFGRFTEHIGFWSPRHNVNIKRQVILNTPRLMYWLANGAIPTPKVHNFLTMFGFFPKQWHYVKSASERAQQAKNQKPLQQLKPKQKKLRERSRRRREQQELKPYNYHRYESMAMFPNKQRSRIMAKQHADQFQNSVIRDILHETDFQKYDRLAQLSNRKEDQLRPIDQQLQQVKEKLLKHRSQLALLQSQQRYSNLVKKSKIIEVINRLMKRLNQLQTVQYTRKKFQEPQKKQQYITEEYLQNRLKYELVVKKMQKSQEQLQKLSDLCQPVTLGEMVSKMKQTRLKQIEKNKNKVKQQDKQENAEPNIIDFANSSEEDIVSFAQTLYYRSCENLAPFTKLQLLTLTQHNQQIENMFSLSNQFDNPNSSPKTHKQFLQLALKQDSFLPTIRPVHPLPDLKSYIPQQHYDPIDVNKLDIMMINSLQPEQQLQKYKQKRNFQQSSAERKKQEQRKRMERLRIVTEN